MKISEAKSYSLLKSESGGSELSIYEEYSLNPGCVVQITNKENERYKVPDNSSSISEAMSSSTDVHQKSVLANIEKHENSSFIQPCSVSITRIDVEKYVHQRDTVDFNENISDSLNSSSCSSFDTRTDMDGMKLEMIKRYLDNCATNFAIENENQVSFLYDKESSEISENRKPFDVDSAEVCMPFSFSKQNNIDNSSAIEVNNNAYFSSVSSEHDYLNNADLLNICTKNRNLHENVKNPSNYSLKDCRVVVEKMNVDDWLISECMNRGKKELITDYSNCIERDNLSHSSIQTGNSFEDDVKNTVIKGGYKTFQNHDCSNKCHSEISSLSLKGKTVSCSSEPANVIDFKSLQSEHDKEIYSEDSESEIKRDALFVKSARRKQIKMSKMMLKEKCQTKNIKNGDNLFSFCEISGTEESYHTKGDETTNQKQRMRLSSSEKYRNFSQRKHNKILEFGKDILNAKQSDIITETKLRCTDVHVPSDGVHLEKQNILKHEEKTDVIMLNNTYENGNKLFLKNNMKKTAEYPECEPYFRKYENERMIKINCIRKETKDTFIPNSSKKVLDFTSSLISKNVRNDKIRFNKTGFNLYSGSAVLGNKKMSNCTLDNAKISISYENDEELKVKYGLKDCYVYVHKLPLSSYTTQVSEYQDNFTSGCEKNSEKNNIHYLNTKTKTNTAKSNYEFKKKQIGKKHILPVGARKKCNIFVSRKGSFKLKPKVLHKSIKDIESCIESDVDVTECNKNGSECNVEIGYPRYEKKLQISTLESGKFKRNTECCILKSRKKQNRRNSNLNKKKYEPVMQEAPYSFRTRKRGSMGDIEIIEIESDTSECDSDVKDCHYDKTSVNISDISDCGSDIKECQSDKILGKIVYGKEPRKINEEKVSQKLTCNKYRIHSFHLSKDENSKIMKPFLENQERYDMKNGKLKKKTSAKSVCFKSLEANQCKELKQNCIPICNEILPEVRGDDNVHEINSHTFISVKCEGNDNKEIVQDGIVKCNKISSEVSGKAKVHEINSDTFMPVECDSDKHSKHVLLEELDEKYAAFLKRYSIKFCFVVLEKMNLEECQNNFEGNHETPFTEKKVMKNLKSSSNNTNQLSIFKKAHSVCNTSLIPVGDKKRMSLKDIIDKENKNMLKADIYSSNCKPGREDMKCCSKHVIKTNINKLFSTKLKPSQRRVKYNSKASGESRKCQSEYAETNYKNKFRRDLPFVKIICEEKEAMNIANTGENLSKNDMIDSIEQYKAEREIEEGLEYCEKPLLEVGLNKDISSRTNCNLNKVNNCDYSMKNWVQCKKYEFKSDESISEELKEQNLNTKGELRKNGLAISDNINLTILEGKTGKNSAYLESSVLCKRDGREVISVDAKYKSRVNGIEYNSSSDIFMNVKESVKENHFKNECEYGCWETFVPAHMNHSKTMHNKSLKTNIKKTEENEDVSLPVSHCAVEVDKPASLIDIAEGCVSFKCVSETDVKPVPFRTKYKRLRNTPSVQNTKKSRTCLMNNFMTEYREPVNSFEVEELKPHSLFSSGDYDNVLELSARNRIVNRNSSWVNKTLPLYDKNTSVNFDKQIVRGNIKGNVDDHFRRTRENNRIIDYNAYKTKADNSSLSSPPEGDYHEVLCRREKFTCFQCGKYVHSAKGLFYHTCPGKRAIGYLCYFCERIFLSLKELELHKRIHKR